MRSGAKMCASRSESWLPTRGSHVGPYAKSITAEVCVFSPTVHPPEMVALHSLCELLLLRAQDSVVDESCGTHTDFCPAWSWKCHGGESAAAGRDPP